LSDRAVDETQGVGCFQGRELRGRQRGSVSPTARPTREDMAAAHLAATHAHLCVGELRRHGAASNSRAPTRCQSDHHAVTPAPRSGPPPPPCPSPPCRRTGTRIAPQYGTPTPGCHPGEAWPEDLTPPSPAP